MDYATTKEGTLVKGKWAKLDDGRFGASLRVGGNGAAYVGKVVTLTSKAGNMETVTLVSLVKDYGAGDVALYAVER